MHDESVWICNQVSSSHYTQLHLFTANVSSSFLKALLLGRVVLSFAALLIMVLEQKNRCRKQGKQTKRFLCCGADSRSGSSRQLWEEIFVCLTVPSYHTAVPGAYSTKIGWILPLSENEIKLNFNCLWAIFIMELQPLQIYSERSKGSANLLARYVLHSHLSLLWDTSGASIANVWLDVEKKSITILGKMIYVKLAG